MDPKSMAYLAAGLAMGLAGIGTALGIAILTAKGLESMARQPEAAGTIRTAMLIGIAFVEAIALYALVISFLLSAK